MSSNEPKDHSDQMTKIELVLNDLRELAREMLEKDIGAPNPLEQVRLALFFMEMHVRAATRASDKLAAGGSIDLTDHPELEKAFEVLADKLMASDDDDDDAPTAKETH